MHSIGKGAGVRHQVVQSSSPTGETEGKGGRDSHRLNNSVTHCDCDPCCQLLDAPAARLGKNNTSTHTYTHANTVRVTQTETRATGSAEAVSIPHSLRSHTCSPRNVPHTSQTRKLAIAAAVVPGVRAEPVNNKRGDRCSSRRCPRMILVVSDHEPALSHIPVHCATNTRKPITSRTSGDRDDCSSGPSDRRYPPA